MSELLFIRHVETAMAGRFCGHSDPPINRCGEAQIRTLLASIDLEAISVIYCSDLQRSVTTARAVAERRDVPLHPTDALREMYFGAWEGLDWQEVVRRDPVYARRWMEAFPNLPAPGGETYSDFETRVLRAIDQLPTHSGQLTAVVTHAGVMRVVLAASATTRGCGTQEDAWSRSIAYGSTLRCTGRPSQWKALS